MCVAVRRLEVSTNILIRSMGPVSEEHMVGSLVDLTVRAQQTAILMTNNRLCRVRCYSFDPSVVSIDEVSGRPIATVIVHTMVLDDYCLLTS